MWRVALALPRDCETWQMIESAHMLDREDLAASINGAACAPARAICGGAREVGIWQWQGDQAEERSRKRGSGARRSVLKQFSLS